MCGGWDIEQFNRQTKQTHTDVSVNNCRIVGIFSSNGNRETCRDFSI